MNTNNLRWSVTFWVKDEELFQEFIKWMEGDHIPKVHATGFFEKKYRTLLHQKDGEDLYAVQYLHTPRSIKDWNDYKKGPRPALRDEFKERWKTHLEDGSIGSVGLMGFLETIETVD